MSKYLIVIALLALAVIVGMQFINSSRLPQVQVTPTPTVAIQKPTSSTSAATATPADAITQPEDTMRKSEVRTFTVTGKDFSFAPNQIRVNKGDTVKIIFKNTGGIHDFVVSGYNVATQQISSGEEETIQFIADQQGTFEFYCSVGSHRLMGMKGSLIVE